jgi:hypothetical protein
MRILYCIFYIFKKLIEYNCVLVIFVAFLLHHVIMSWKWTVECHFIIKRMKEQTQIRPNFMCDTTHKYICGIKNKYFVDDPAVEFD